MDVGPSTENLKDVEVNIGVIGSAKQGKSSLVNALMKLKNTDPGAATVISELESADDDVKKFPHPKFKLIFLWDLPGITFENKKNYEKLITNPKGKKIHYDMLIVVFKDILKNAVTMEAIRLANKLEAKILFVRTHFDTTLDGVKRAEGIDTLSQDRIDKSKGKVKGEILEAGKKELKYDIPEKDVYLVDTENWREHDFEKLHSDFLNESFRWIVDKKYQLFTQRINDKKNLMGIGKASKIFEKKVDSDIINEVLIYLNAFELTRSQLDLLQGIRQEDRERLNDVIDATLKGNELVYQVWNSKVDINVGGWEGVLEKVSAVNLVGSGAAFVARSQINSELAFASAICSAGLAASLAIKTCSENCGEILKAALDVAKDAAVLRDTIVYDA